MLAQDIIRKVGKRTYWRDFALGMPIGGGELEFAWLASIEVRAQFDQDKGELQTDLVLLFDRNAITPAMTPTSACMALHNMSRNYQIETLLVLFEGDTETIVCTPHALYLSPVVKPADEDPDRVEKVEQYDLLLIVDPILDQGE